MSLLLIGAGGQGKGKRRIYVIAFLNANRISPTSIYSVSIEKWYRSNYGHSEFWSVMFEKLINSYISTQYVVEW